MASESETVARVQRMLRKATGNDRLVVTKLDPLAVVIPAFVTELQVTVVVPKK